MAEICPLFEITNVKVQTIEQALNIAEHYHYSYYDSVIIAAALETSCSILYSEDLQHGQLIEKKLKIINPFL